MVYLSEPHIARFELDTFDFLSALIREQDIPCSWEAPGGVHSIISEEVVSLTRRRLEQLQASHPDLASRARLVTDRDELRRLRVLDNHLGAVVQDRAAKCWPYKLVCWVLEKLLLENPWEQQHNDGAFNLQTGTPVVHVQRRPGSQWIVHTERGQVSAAHVVLATNAYISRLLPRLTGAITPVRGQICALVPPAESTPLEHTHVWSLQKEGDPGESDDYLVQRPSGELILGGERMSVADGGEGVSSDNEVDPAVGRRLRSALHSMLCLSPSDPPELEASYEWTGIMGYSADGHPWVGCVPEGLGGGGSDGDGGLWVSAGYTGHGMPVAARCGIAVAERILGKEGGHITVQVPPEWEISEGRVQAAAKGSVMPCSFREELRVLVERS
jgi:glycine/D-amino acid oxidase-like deaminating enzyme